MRGGTSWRPGRLKIRMYVPMHLLHSYHVIEEIIAIKIGCMNECIAVIDLETIVLDFLNMNPFIAS